jgi:hypothetical protein
MSINQEQFPTYKSLLPVVITQNNRERDANHVGRRDRKVAIGLPKPDWPQPSALCHPLDQLNADVVRFLGKCDSPV